MLKGCAKKLAISCAQFVHSKLMLSTCMCVVVCEQSPLVGVLSPAEVEMHTLPEGYKTSLSTF